MSLTFFQYMLVTKLSSTFSPQIFCHQLQFTIVNDILIVSQPYLFGDFAWSRDVTQIMWWLFQILVRLMQRVVNDMTVMLQKQCHQNIKRQRKISKFLDFIQDKDERMLICACDMVYHQKKTFKIDGSSVNCHERYSVVSVIPAPYGAVRTLVHFERTSQDGMVLAKVYHL